MTPSTAPTSVNIPIPVIATTRIAIPKMNEATHLRIAI